MLGVLFAAALFLPFEPCTGSCYDKIASHGDDDEQEQTIHLAEEVHGKSTVKDLGSSLSGNVQYFNVGDSGRTNGNRSSGVSLK